MCCPHQMVLLEPEEWVRQHVIQALVSQAGRSPACNGVAGAIGGWGSRVDIACFDRSGRIALAAEVKAPEVPLDQKVADQFTRYDLAPDCPWLPMSNGLRTQWHRSADGVAFRTAVGHKRSDVPKGPGCENVDDLLEIRGIRSGSGLRRHEGSGTFRAWNRRTSSPFPASPAWPKCSTRTATLWWNPSAKASALRCPLPPVELEDISIFTYEEDLPLAGVLNALYAHLKGEKAPMPRHRTPNSASS